MNNGKNEIRRRISFMANFKKPNVLWTVIIAISIALLGAGCLSRGVNSKVYDIWAPPFEGSQWGLSESEVMDVLGLTDDDIDRSEIISSKIFIPKKKYDLFGVTMTPKFLFDINGDALDSIIVMLNEEDLDVVEKKITEKLGEGQYGYCLLYTSPSPRD